MEVEVRESPDVQDRKPDSSLLLVNNTPVSYGEATEVVVRVEEVLLVLLVLLIWVAAIALFINRWGKIRMLEPYQPKFHQQPHRPSCPLAPLSPPLPPTNQSRAQKLQCHRMSFSKYNVNAMTDPLSALPSPIIRKPRRSSVFVGSSPAMAILDPPPRRTKSAVDIHHLVINERSPTFSLTDHRKGSIIPILNRDRRPSITTIEKSPIYLSHHRASVSIERPIVALQQCKSRRSSCFVERPVYGHVIPTPRVRNFSSFEHSENCKRMSQPSCSFHHHQPLLQLSSVSSKDSSSSVNSYPSYVNVNHNSQNVINVSSSSSSYVNINNNTATTTSFVNVHSSPTYKPLVLIESSYLRETCPILTLPKMSRSFEQPARIRPKPERMANSLEMTVLSCERTSIKEEESRCSSPEQNNLASPERCVSPVSIYIEDTKVTAPLLEGLKSSDV